MAARNQTEGVVLIHGLGRTRLSMWPMARRLRADGWQVELASYPSRRLTIEAAAARVAGQVASLVAEHGWKGVNLVGHSLGGLIARHLLLHRPDLNVRRVVQLGTPNAGTAAARRLQPWAVPRAVLGPVLGQVAGMSPEVATASPVGSIAGTRGPRWLAKAFGLDGQSDGVVTTRSAWAGAGARTGLAEVHTFLPVSARAARLVSQFLETGSFGGEATP